MNDGRMNKKLITFMTCLIRNITFQWWVVIQHTLQFSVMKSLITC